MSRRFDPDDPAALDERFAEDLRTAFPPTEVPDRVVEAHVAAMMAATPEPGVAPEVGIEWAEAAPSAPLGSTMRRRSMSERMFKRALAVVGAIVLSIGSLAIAGAFPGSGDQGDDDQAVVVDAPEDDQGDVADAVDQDEDADESEAADQGEDADDQGEDADDQGEDADDQGEDADDQGEDADDATVADDDQGEDGDDQGEDEGNDAGQDEGNDAGQDESNDDGANAGDDQGGAEDGDGGDSQD